MSGQTGRRLVGKISTPAAPKVEPVAPPNECFQNVFAEATTAVTDKLFIVTCTSSRQKQTHDRFYERCSSRYCENT